MVASIWSESRAVSSMRSAGFGAQVQDELPAIDVGKEVLPEPRNEQKRREAEAQRKP